jgi:hypothetical protein
MAKADVIIGATGSIFDVSASTHLVDHVGGHHVNTFSTTETKKNTIHSHNRDRDICFACNCNSNTDTNTRPLQRRRGRLVIVAIYQGRRKERKIRDK